MSSNRKSAGSIVRRWQACCTKTSPPWRSDNGIIDYATFVREIEVVVRHGETAIVMGSEIIQPVGKAPRASQTVRRRFTNVRIRRGGEWRLSARHANVICPD